MWQAARMDLHPALAPLAGLLGTWRGTGHGVYPTIDPFDYGEEVTFAHVGKPFLSYVQRTWEPDSGAPMHSELGFLRATGADRVELVIAQPFGATEALVGTVEDGRLRLRSQAVVTTPTAKRIDAVERDVTVTRDAQGPVLRYDLRMAAVGEPMTHHLAAELRPGD